MNCVLIQEPHFVLSFSHLGSSMALSRKGMQSRSEPKNIYITTEEQSGDGNYCVGFSKACVYMKNAWAFHREALGWTRSWCFLHLELLKWNSVAHSCPVLRDEGICQTMLLRARLTMVSVQLCSCNAENASVFFLYPWGFCKNLRELLNGLESIGKACCVNAHPMLCYWSKGLLAFIQSQGKCSTGAFPRIKTDYVSG